MSCIIDWASFGRCRWKLTLYRVNSRDAFLHYSSNVVGVEMWIFLRSRTSDRRGDQSECRMTSYTRTRYVSRFPRTCNKTTSAIKSRIVRQSIRRRWPRINLRRNQTLLRWVPVALWALRLAIVRIDSTRGWCVCMCVCLLCVRIMNACSGLYKRTAAKLYEDLDQSITVAVRRHAVKWRFNVRRRSVAR